jgi:hypothetical protein
MGRFSQQANKFSRPAAPGEAQIAGKRQQHRRGLRLAAPERGAILKVNFNLL